MATTVDGSTGVSQIQDDKVTVDKLNLISTGSVPSLEAKGTSGVTSGYLKLNCSENSHGIKLLGPPHSATADYTLTFPNNDGDADQFLQTNGSGVMSWAAAGGGGTDLLSTVATSGATSYVATIDFTGYKLVSIYIDLVSHSAGTSGRLQFQPNGGSVSEFNNYDYTASNIIGQLTNHSLASGVFLGAMRIDPGIDGLPLAASFGGVNSGFTTSTTTITYNWSNNATFDGGAIRLYGHK
jgi:hypothetical protein